MLSFFDASIPASLRFIIFSFSPFGIELLFKLLLTLIINYWHISLEYEFDIIVDKINIIKNIVFIIFPHFVKQIAGELKHRYIYGGIPTTCIYTIYLYTD